jgi:hypothetical protein
MPVAYNLLFSVALNGEGPVQPALRLKAGVLGEADPKYHA